jgi:hypothetical protein
MAAAQASQKQAADKTRRAVSYSVGQQVMLNTKHLNLKFSDTPKLLPRWVGPFNIAAPVGSTRDGSPAVAYRLELPASMKRVHNVFHVSLLKSYVASQRTQPPPPPVAMSDGDWHTIDSILKHRSYKHRQPSYLVRWAGYGPEYDQWLPESAVTETAVKEYWDSLAQRQR